MDQNVEGPAGFKSEIPDLINLANFKFGYLVSQPQNDITTMT